MSWTCPGVNDSATGLPSASTTAWIFVVRPPRERRWLGSRRLFLSAGAVLVRAHGRRVEHHELVVGVTSECFENPRKHAAFAPSAVAPVRCLPAPVPLRQIAPGDARAVTIDDGIDEQSVVGSRAADVTVAAGQEVWRDNQDGNRVNQGENH
jgi:hypothetical protein